jgi:hypothetical protein
MKTRIIAGAILLILPLIAWAGAHKEYAERLFGIGAGYGIPYGHIGINLEVNPLLPTGMHRVNNYFSFSLGLGYKRDSPLMAMGVNTYPLGRSALITPRFSFHYSKMDRIRDKWNTWEEDYDTLDALILGGGLGFRLNESLSFRADAFYLLHVYNDFSDEEIGGRFKFALGAQLNLQSRYQDQSAAPADPRNPSFMQIGLGAGIPYGGIGVNLEFSPLLPGNGGRALNAYSSLLIGSGFSPAGSAYSLGLRLYPLGKEKTYRPRLGLHFGTVGFVKWRGGSYSSLEGLAFSAGTLYRIGQNLAIDCDLVIIAALLHGWELNDLNSLIKVAFGLRWLL